MGRFTKGVDIVLIYTIIYLGLGLLSSVTIYAMAAPMTRKNKLLSRLREKAPTSETQGTSAGVKR
jgi:hypothetical protein